MLPKPNQRDERDRDDDRGRDDRDDDRRSRDRDSDDAVIAVVIVVADRDRGRDRGVERYGDSRHTSVSAGVGTLSKKLENQRIGGTGRNNATAVGGGQLETSGQRR